MPKIEREYRTLCRTEGVHLCRLERRGRHFMLQFANGIVFAAGTPSDRRNMLNVRAAIRRVTA